MLSFWVGSGLECADLSAGWGFGWGAKSGAGRSGPAPMDGVTSTDRCMAWCRHGFDNVTLSVGDVVTMAFESEFKGLGGRFQRPISRLTVLFLGHWVCVFWGAVDGVVVEGLGDEVDERLDAGGGLFGG